MGKSQSKRRTRKRRTRKLRTNGGENCQLLDTKVDRYTSNEVWKTCIRQNGKINIIYYVIPKNAIMKDIYTIRNPKFALKHKGKIGEFSIQIENQFVSCFLYINGQWYAFAMLNLSVFEYFSFYRINELKSLYNSNGTIILKNATTISTDVININNTTRILKENSTEVYELMNNFATQKMTASQTREFAVDMVAFNWLYDDD